MSFLGVWQMRFPDEAAAKKLPELLGDEGKPWFRPMTFRDGSTITSTELYKADAPGAAIAYLWTVDFEPRDGDESSAHHRFHSLTTDLVEGLDGAGGVKFLGALPSDPEAASTA